MKMKRSWGSWNEDVGMVSRAFDDWKLVHEDIRAFMRLGISFSRKAYNEIWNRVAGEPPKSDSDDLPDVFNREIEGLWPHDFEWMLLGAVVKDAVTSFEVYLERAADEVLGHHGLSPLRKELEYSPYWGDLKTFYGSHLGVMIESAEVKRIRDLRHLLTHQRGELRTKKQRQTYQAPDDIMARYATLRENDVDEHLRTLGQECRRIDPVVYRHSWEGDRIESLLQEGRAK